MKTCTWESLVKQFGDYSWRFSDTHGACMTLETYTKYTKSIEGQTDDAPLAVYDSQFHLDDRITLIDDYQVPPCFSGFDLFQNVLEDYTNDDGDERDSNVLAPPPYRWILMVCAEFIKTYQDNVPFLTQLLSFFETFQRIGTCSVRNRTAY